MSRVIRAYTVNRHSHACHILVKFLILNHKLGALTTSRRRFGNMERPFYLMPSISGDCTGSIPRLAPSRLTVAKQRTTRHRVQAVE